MQKCIFISFILVIFVLLTSCKECKTTQYTNGKVEFERCLLTNSSLIKVTQYDTSGNIISITFENKKGERDSIATYFYPNGVKKQIVPFVNGKYFGLLTSYYPNGHIKETVNFKDGEMEGKLKIYYPSGKLKKILFYKRINNKTVLNWLVVFNKKEEIVSDSSYYADITLSKDTINTTEFLMVSFDICKPAGFGSVVYADFDKDFNIKDSSSIRFIKEVDKPYKIKPNKKGNDTLRMQFKIYDSKTKMFFPIYLEKPFYVK